MSEAIDYFVQSHHTTVDGRQAPLGINPRQDPLEYDTFPPTTGTISGLSKWAMTPSEVVDTQIPSRPELNDYTWSELLESYNPLEQLDVSSTTDYYLHGDCQSVLSSSEAIACRNPAMALVPKAPSLLRTSRLVREAFPDRGKPTPDTYFKQASPATDLVLTDSKTPPIKVRRRRRRKPPLPPDEAAARRTAFLQRNRDAASKCREKKKDQIRELENEERMGQHINQVLKNELKEVLGEIAELRKQAREIPCEDDCEGCGQHAPQRRDKLVVSTTSLLSTSMFSEREDTDDIDQEIKISTTTSPSC